MRDIIADTAIGVIIVAMIFDCLLIVVMLAKKWKEVRRG